MAISLPTPERIRSLQRKLHLEAKAEPDFRFYLLYDEVHRDDVLLHAWCLARANKGAPGVDGQSFEEMGRGDRGVGAEEVAVRPPG